MENKRTERLKSNYLFIGLGLGAAGAVLLMPKTGKEMREGIAGVAMLLVSKFVKEGLDKLMNRVAEQISEAFEAGKQTYMEEKSRDKTQSQVL